MKKKWFKIAFLMVLPLVVGLACQLSNPINAIVNKVSEELLGNEGAEESEVLLTESAGAEEIVETLEPVTGEEQDLVMFAEDFWIQEEGSVYLSFYFHNPNADILFEDIEYTIFLYDGSGGEITTYTSSLRYLFPQETFGLSEIVYLDDEIVTVDSVEIEWTYLSGAVEEFTNPFTVEDITYWENDDFPMVSGKIVNNSSNTYTYILANVICLDSNDQIVGSGYTTIQFLPGNDFMGFTTYVDVFSEVSSVEVYPTYTYSSYYYEGDEFWSEISISEDNFFMDDYGYLLGGMVVENKIDVPLSNSIAYVTFYDESDAVTSVAAYTLDFILPGDTVGVAPWASTPPAESVTTSYDILVLPGDYEDDYEVADNPFVVNSAVISGEYDENVTVNFTNGYSKSASEVNVNVLIYDTDGNIIGGGYSWYYDPIPAGGNAEMDIWVDYDQNANIGAIEAWVYPNSWTEFK